MNTPHGKAVDRLEAILATEIEALRSGDPVNLAEITTRKNQSLLELTRLTRSLHGPDPAMRTRLEGLKTSVEENRRVLGLHVKASHEVAGLISRAIAEAESDGTYSARTGRKGTSA